jgi:hypothetical protein
MVIHQDHVDVRHTLNARHQAGRHRSEEELSRVERIGATGRIGPCQQVLDLAAHARVVAVQPRRGHRAGLHGSGAQLPLQGIIRRAGSPAAMAACTVALMCKRGDELPITHIFAASGLLRSSYP